MKTKTVDSIDVICATEELTVPEIGKWSKLISPLIDAEVEKYNLQKNGPWIFVSHGRNGDMANQIQVDFCLPVKNTAAYKGSLKIKTLDPFQCAYIEYKGDMSAKMLGGQGYDPLVQSIRESGKQFTGESREVYTNWISNRSKDNEFEIQFGII
jgi:effector-binding domain-containing protein